MDFAVPVDQKVKIKETKKAKQILGTGQITKKAEEHESDSDIC